MKTTILNQVTLCADGSIGLQWLKQFIDDDTGEVVFSEPHRSVVDFEGDVGAQITAVRDQLQPTGYPVDAEKHIALVNKIDEIGKADPDLAATRAAKIKERPH